MPYQGEIAALVAAALWSTTAILFETTGKRIGAMNTNLLRLLLASLLLCLTFFIQTGTLYPIHATTDQHFWLGLSGVIGLALGDAALFVCLVILGPRLATLMLSLAPVITTLFAWLFLDEKLNALAIFGIVLTIGGIVWVVNETEHEPSHGSKMQGIILGVIAALGQGFGVILAKYGFRTEIGTLDATLLRMLPATLVMWLVMLMLGKLKPIPGVLHDRKSVQFIIIASIIGPFIGVWLANAAVKYTEAGIAATLLATVPILVIPLVWIIHGTRPSLRAVMGTCIAVAGVALIFLR